MTALLAVSLAKAAAQEVIAAAYQASVHTRRQSKDGVVVTPVQVVDFQVRAAISEIERQAPLTDPRVRILDPFGGTGIYLARFLQLADLDPTEKVDLARRMRMVEICPTACQYARANLSGVMWQETAQTVIRPQVICADTFTLEDDVWTLREEASL